MWPVRLRQWRLTPRRQKMQKRSYSDMARVAHLTSVRGVLPRAGCRVRTEAMISFRFAHPMRVPVHVAQSSSECTPVRYSRPRRSQRAQSVACHPDEDWVAQDPLQQFRMPEPRLRFVCRALALDDSGQLAGSELVGVDMLASPVVQLHQLGLRRARVVGQPRR